MAQTLAADGSNGRRHLEETRVFLDRCDGEDIPDSRITKCLDVSERHIRAVAVLEPATELDAKPEFEHWHINAERELHLLRTGTGQFEFITLGGVVSVVMEPGDVIEIGKVEHRFRAFTPTTWVIRHTGSADAELDPRLTNRDPEPWLAVKNSLADE